MRSHAELHAEIAVRNEVCNATSEKAYFRIHYKFYARSGRNAHIYLQCAFVDLIGN